MGSIYVAARAEASVSVPQDLMTIRAPTSAAVIIHEVKVIQTSDTDSEQILVRLRRTPQGGSGAGIAVIPRGLQDESITSRCLVTANNTTQATGGDIVHVDGWNVLGGWHYLPAPEHRIVVGPGDFFNVQFDKTPNSPLTVSTMVVFEEIG